MTLALKVSNELTSQIRGVLERIQRHEGLTNFDKKALSEQLAVALLSVSTIRQKIHQGAAGADYLEELHRVSALVSKFNFFITQLKEKVDV